MQSSFCQQTWWCFHTHCLQILILHSHLHSMDLHVDILQHQGKVSLLFCQLCQLRIAVPSHVWWSPWDMFVRHLLKAAGRRTWWHCLCLGNWGHRLFLQQLHHRSDIVLDDFDRVSICHWNTKKSGQPDQILSKCRQATLGTNESSGLDLARTLGFGTLGQKSSFFLRRPSWSFESCPWPEWPGSCRWGEGPREMPSERPTDCASAHSRSGWPSWTGADERLLENASWGGFHPPPKHELDVPTFPPSWLKGRAMVDSAAKAFAKPKGARLLLPIVLDAAAEERIFSNDLPWDRTGFSAEQASLVVLEVLKEDFLVVGDVVEQGRNWSPRAIDAWTTTSSPERAVQTKWPTCKLLSVTKWSCSCSTPPCFHDSAAPWTLLSNHSWVEICSSKTPSMPTFFHRRGTTPGQDSGMRCSM